ncbi:hypothetical protein AAFC00_005707 [Neodothiora populina]|uniref:chitinase n=1 Tax=Neodothiora populina TaxID=2781224 RepID=A0ABR3P5J8_9PEZI
MRATHFAATAATLAGLASAFDASSKTNVVAYWGQGNNQGSLLSYCQNPNIDVINIGFVNVFPDQGNAGWPGTNFGDACGTETYTYNNISTQLLSNCPDIGPDIVLCQEIYGTKILLSIGGADADGFNNNDESGANFARFLWGAFGPSLDEWTQADGPRPFKDAVVDGFDFDIESTLNSAPVSNGSTITDYKTRGWATMANTFKSELFPKDGSKSYYLSAAPQCVVPDEHLSTVIANAWFDFIFVQYYNTAQCSARSALLSRKRQTGFTGYDNWSGASSLNPNVKIYMGLAASTDTASDASYYIDPAGVDTLVGEIFGTGNFGGIMLWQVSAADDNVICGRDYATWMKQILTARAAGSTIDTEINPCPAQTISPDGTCGTYNGYTCAGSIFGSCCSIYGYCGDTSEYCALATCDTIGGNCGNEFVGVTGTTNATSSATASSSGPITTAANSTAAVTSNSTISESAAGAVLATGASTNGPLMTTSIVFATAAQTVSTTNAAGEATVYVTDVVTSYTTVCPVTAGEASATSSAALSAVTADANLFYTTSTVYGTVTNTVSTMNEIGEATVYVTEDVTSYTTVCPVTATESGSTSSASSDEATSTTTTTVHTTSTAYSTVVSSSSPVAALRIQSLSSVSLNSSSSSSISSSISSVNSTTTVSNTPASNFPMSSTPVSSVVSTVTTTTLSAVPTPVVNYGALYAASNSSSMIYPTAVPAPLTSSSVYVQVVTATIAPVQVQVYAAHNVSSAATVPGVASSTTAYQYVPTHSGMAFYTGAASRLEFSIGAAAIALGAIFFI